MVITLLHNLAGPLGVDQLNIWANEFGLDHPVVDDADQELSKLLWPDNQARPNAVLLGPGAEVLAQDPSPEQVTEFVTQ